MHVTWVNVRMWALLDVHRCGSMCGCGHFGGRGMGRHLPRTTAKAKNMKGRKAS